MKKILYVGNLNKYTRSYQRYLALIKLGYEVVGLSLTNEKNIPGISNKPNIWARFRQRIGYPLDKEGINQKIIYEIRNNKFGLIWIEKGLMVRPKTLQLVKDIDPQLVLVFNSEDNMFKTHNQSIYFLQCLPLYDIVFTTKSCNIEELPTLGAQRVFFIDKSYSSLVHKPIDISKEEYNKYRTNVGFIGSYEYNRADFMHYLSQKGVSIRIWGNGWEKWKKINKNLEIKYKPLYGREYVKAICSTKINLCFLRKTNNDLQTGRTMEIPACGGFMLAERTDEHLRLFREGIEAEYFSDKKELLEKVNYYLIHEERREKIIKASRNRCLKSGYSHCDRLKYMLKKIKEIKNK